jgi:hypothetical protein
VTGRAVLAAALLAISTGFWRAATSARAYLTDLQKEGEKPTLKDDVILLFPSSYGDGEKSTGVTISRSFSRFFDIACLPGPDDFKNNTGCVYAKDLSPDALRIATDTFSSRAVANLSSGTYEMKIVVGGLDFRPKPCTVKITFEDAAVVSVSKVECA